VALGALLAAICLSTPVSGAEIDLMGKLPQGWSEAGPEAFGPTRLGDFPPVTRDGGAVRFAAVDRARGGALMVVRKNDRLRPDADTKDALAVAAPVALSDAWGVPFRILWADAAVVGGRRTIQLQGSFDAAAGDRVALMTWVPDSGGHHLVVGLMPKARGDDLGALVEDVVAALPGAPASRTQEGLARLLVASALAAVLGVGGLFLMRRRRGVDERGGPGAQTGPAGTA
jgi:hypothetical protein